jgi:hypothetical protein
VENTLMFKQCPMCNMVWETREAFLADPGLRVVGYQVHFEQLTAGIFILVHICGTSLGIEAEKFADLYDGEMFEARATGTEACPGYCLAREELRPCPAKCECAYVREVLQIVRHWPKANAGQTA